MVVSAAERLLAEIGRPRELGSDRPFLLSGLNGWYVRSGRVDLFAVQLEQGRATGARSHFLRAEAGQFLFGFGGDRARKVGLLAVGAIGTELVEVEEGELRRLARDAEHSPLIASLVETWVDVLCSSISGDRSPDEILDLEQGEFVSSKEDGVRLRPTRGALWVRSRNGPLHLLGNEALTMATDAPTPISRRAWFAAPAHASLVAEESVALVGRDEMWLGLGRLHDLIVDFIVQKKEADVVAERERLRQKAMADHWTITEACASIASTLEGARPRTTGTGLQPAAAGDDSLIAACGELAEVLGVELKPVAGQEAGATRDPLAALARASRFRTRPVLLRDGWWRSDGGPMLAFFKEPRRALVLLPTRSGYVARDPVERTEVRVQAELADRLEPLAHSFYRPFSERALSLFDLIEFGLKGCGRDIVNIVAMGTAVGLLGLVVPIITGMIFNDVIPGAEREQLLQLTFIMIVIAVATALFNASSAIALVRLDGRMGASLQGGVFDRLLALPMQFFRRFTAGDLASRAMGIDAIRQVLSGTVLTSLLTGFYSLFHLILLFYYSPTLGWWATLLLAVAVLATGIAGRLQLKAERSAASIRTTLAGKVLQFLTSISKLRVAGSEIQAFSIWARGFSQQRRYRFKSRSVGNVLAAFNAGFPLTCQLIIFALAMPLLTRAEDPLRTGDFLAFLVSFTTCLGGLLGASAALIGAATVVPLYEQAKPILETLPEVDSGKIDPGPLSGEIGIQNVRFRYDPDGSLVLHDVKLEIRAGEFVALVGPSGSGKSTLLRLLLGFEEPEAGAIYYDRHELAALDHQAVRAQIGVVLQNGRLMPGDIYSNIVGSSLATLDDAWEAARMAGLDADIEEMPMKMHTVISEGGGTLSGGQRQRLMIARALVRRPRMLFFDEATSALDNRTQSIVSESLDRLHATRIVVAHRLSTIMHADRIYVLEAGRVVESGTYAELLDRGGLFAELARRQMA